MNYFWAFVVGGGICVIGQLLIDLTGLTPARILTGYVVAGVILGAVYYLWFYEKYDKKKEPRDDAASDC